MINETVYVWLIDGIPTAFATSESFTLAMAESLGFASVHYGLIHPTGLAATLELRTGMLEDTTATIQVEDVDESLAALFGSGFDDSELLVSSLAPATDPAPAYLYDKHVGTEKIGPAGERRQHSCIPGWNVGLQHWGGNQANAFGLGSAPYGADPVIWPGRRCAIYRLVKGASTWGEPQRIWWGTMLGQGSLEGRTWSFRCAGPESWLGGNLGVGSIKEPIQVEATVAFSNDEIETEVRGSIYIYSLQTAQVEYTYTSSYIDTTCMAGASSYDDVAQAMSDFLDDLIVDAGGPYDYLNVSMATTPGSDGITVTWEKQNDPNGGGASDSWALQVMIQAHEKVWQILGYDPRQQNSDRHPIENADEYGQFSTAGQKPQLTNRWAGRFYSANAKAMAAFEGLDDLTWAEISEDDLSNNWAPRRWPPLASGGGQSWAMESSGQEFIFRTYDPLYIVGGQSRWLLADPTDPDSVFTISNGVGEVNAQGIMVFEGPYRKRGDEDGGSKDPGASKAEREGRSKQVARVCWRASADGNLELDNDGYPRAVIAEWLEPRLYGIDWPRLTGSWGGWRSPPADAIANTALPLTVFESDAYKEITDNVEHVFHSLLSTTGTGAGFGGTASTYTVGIGANGPALAGLDVDYLDIESANVGLGIPEDLIGDTARLRAQLGVSNLLQSKAAFVGPISARKLVQTLLAPSGASISLAGGKYSLFDPWTFVDFSDAALSLVSLSPEDYAGDPGDPSSARAMQELRDYSPIDRLEMQARIDPTSGNYAKKIEQRSWDRGAQYRGQTIPMKVDGDHLIHNLVTAPGSQWVSDFEVRWRQGTEFWAASHFPVHITVSANRGEQIWPGQAVIITDPWLADPVRGQYDLSYGVGYVTSRVFSCRDERVELVLLVSASPARYFAPAVSATRYDEDDEAEGYRLHVEDSLYRWNTLNAGDFGGLRNPGILGFQPPSWYSATPIDTDIEIFQFDGVTWTRGIYGTVTSVSLDTFPVEIADHRNPTGWLNLDGPLTGNTYYRDMHHIVMLRKNGEQTADWVAAVYAPICDKDGTSDGSLGAKFT